MPVPRRPFRGRNYATLAFFSMCLCTVAHGQAQPPRPDKEGPRQVTLSLAAAPEPRPALRYALQHDVIDITPGNAAIAYKTALLLFRDVEESQDLAPCREWLDMDVSKMPVDEAARFTGQFGPALDGFTRASRYASCDWQLPIREEGFALLLPHLGDMRDVARVLALRARVRIARGEFDGALEDLRMGLTMARHVGESATLIEGLVGLAIAQLMLDRVGEFTDAPGSPNLYWALTDLSPNPFISFQHAVRWEKNMLYASFPALNDLGRQPITPEQYHAVFRDVKALTGDMGGDLRTDEQARLLGTGLGLAVYPRARQALLDAGTTAEEVESLAVAEVVTRHLLDSYEYHRDETFKWIGLPYPQARQGMHAANTAMKEAMDNDPVGSFLPSLILPALSQAATAFTALDRHIAALRIIEAIRLYAAEQGGRLPPALNAITQVPVPDDPMTGGPFQYSVEGSTVTLALPAVPGDRPRRGRIYEISMEQDHPVPPTPATTRRAP